jgi:hypothetical protein
LKKRPTTKVCGIYLFTFEEAEIRTKAIDYWAVGGHLERRPAFSGKCLQSRLFSFFVRVYQASESVRPNVPPGSGLSELITSRVIIELKEEMGNWSSATMKRRRPAIWPLNAMGFPLRSWFSIGRSRSKAKSQREENGGSRWRYGARWS